MQTPGEHLVGEIWSLDSSVENREIVVTSWEVHEVQLPNRTLRTRHIVGLSGWHREGVVSSAITSVDSAANRLSTESGRIYVVTGSTGGNLDSDFVWRRWQAINGTNAAENVTGQVKQQLTIDVTEWLLTEHPRQSDPRRVRMRVTGTLEGTKSEYEGDVIRFNRSLMEGLDANGRYFKLKGPPVCD